MGTGGGTVPFGFPNGDPPCPVNRAPPVSFNDLDEFKQSGLDMCAAATPKTPCCVFERKEKAGFRAPIILDYVFTCKAVGDGDECKSTTFDEKTMSKMCSAPIEKDLHVGYCSLPPGNNMLFGKGMVKNTGGSHSEAKALGSDLTEFTVTGDLLSDHQGHAGTTLDAALVYFVYGTTPQAAFGITQIDGPPKPGLEVLSYTGKFVKQFTGVDAAVNVYNCADHTRGKECITASYGVEYCYKNGSGYGIVVGALVTASVAVFLQFIGIESFDKKSKRFLVGTIVLLFSYGCVYWSKFDLNPPDRQILALSLTIVAIVVSIFWDRITRYLCNQKPSPNGEAEANASLLGDFFSGDGS